jgi:hypothetical protein
MTHHAANENAAIDDAELQAAIGKVLKEYMAVSIDPTAPGTTPRSRALSRIHPTAATPADVIHHRAAGPSPAQPQTAPYKAEILQNTAMPRHVGQGATQRSR